MSFGKGWPFSLGLIMLRPHTSFSKWRMTSRDRVGRSELRRQTSGNAGDSKSTGNKYSLLMHRIKILSPDIFLWNEQNFLVGGLISFQTVLTLVVLQWQKAYRILAALPFKMSPHWLPWSLASTPWAVSLCLQFRLIYFLLLNEYWWWDQATMYHIIRQLSYQFMWEIMTWSDDKIKLIHKNISIRIRLRSLKPQVKLKFQSQ